MDEGLSSLTALGPLDGRYRKQIRDLSSFFSEFALIRYRIFVEIQYFIFFSHHFLHKKLSATIQKKLLRIVSDFDQTEAEKVKTIEARTHHDVKAVEYYLQTKFDEYSITGKEYIHFGLTSEDINPNARALALTEALHHSIFPAMNELVHTLSIMALETRSIPLLARTHGQAAVGTTIGKELGNFAVRLKTECEILEMLPVEGKVTGAVGNFNALVVAFPKLDVIELCRKFVESLGLSANCMTTQTIPADAQARIFDSLRRFNIIVKGLTQDMWRYISDGYFVIKTNTEEVGSSTMPQKVNPIDFENAEGNLGLANSLLGFFSEKLPISRLQRDLSDSTVLRAIGTALGHSYLAYRSCKAGLDKLSVDEALCRSELDQHWEIITEGLQTLLRLSGDPDAYEKVKKFSRGEHVSEQGVKDFIESLEVSSDTKRQLHALSPETYIGKAEALVLLHLNPKQKLKKRHIKERIV